MGRCLDLDDHAHEGLEDEPLFVGPGGSPGSAVRSDRSVPSGAGDGADLEAAAGPAGG